MVDLKVRQNNREKVPIHCKLNLTLKEAAEYSNIGINRLTNMVDDPRCTFALHVGTKKLIKRQKFEEFINSDSTQFL